MNQSSLYEETQKLAVPSYPYAIVFILNDTGHGGGGGSTEPSSFCK